MMSTVYYALYLWFSSAYVLLSFEVTAVVKYFSWGDQEEEHNSNPACM